MGTLRNTWSQVGWETDAVCDLTTVTDGVMLYELQVHALLLEVLERCPVGDGRKAIVVPPHEIAFLLELADEATKLAFCERIKELDFMYVIVHAENHFAFLQVHFTDPVHVTYKDTIDDDTKMCAQECATMGRRFLHFIAAGTDLPARTNEERQSHSWRCGYWMAFFLEWALWRRVHLHNPNQRKGPNAKLDIAKAMKRDNQFIECLKQLEETRAEKEGPSSLEEAQKAAEKCGKCRKNNKGFKGCSLCMGRYFVNQALRTSKVQQSMKRESTSSSSSSTSSSSDSDSS